MSYCEYQASPFLSPYIETFWTFRTKDEKGRHTQRVLPDGCTDIIFNFGDSVTSLTHESRSLLTGNVYVVGTMTASALTQNAACCDLLGIRFRPAGMFAFMRVALHELKDRVVQLKEVEATLCRMLPPEALATLNNRDRIRRVEAVLLRNLRNKEEGNLVRRASVMIGRSGGRVAIQTVAREVNVSPRHLERLFREQVGVSPKRLSSILRFRALSERLYQGRSESLLQTAFAFGYFDHAHLTREFKSYAGCLPSEYGKI